MTGPGGTVSPAVPVSGRLPAVVGGFAALAPLALVIVAEAAWISVVGGLLQEFVLRDPVIGIPGLAGVVLTGVVGARLAGPRLGRVWPGVALGFVILAGVAGWLSAAEARTALADGIGPALAAHPGGFLAGLALLRGFAHARLPLVESTVTHLLGVGVPGLALAAMLGGVVGDPFRSRFLADALGAAIVFIAATVLALAFARLDAIVTDERFDWRRNPPWLVLTVAMLLGAIAVAVPLSRVAGTLISVAVSVALVPLFLVGIATGFDRTARRVLLFFALVTIAILALVAGPGQIARPDQAPPGYTGQNAPTTGEQVVAASLGGLLLLGAIVAILVLAALWMRRVPPPDGAIGEARSIDPSGDGLATRRRRRRFGRRAVPENAVDAYVALIDDLDRYHDVRRDPAETPAAHAGRLRAGGQTGLALELLAADYALARYGGITLPEREDRRAVGRWRVLRRTLTARGPAGRHGMVSDPAAAPPVEAAVAPAVEPRRGF